MESAIFYEYARSMERMGCVVQGASIIEIRVCEALWVHKIHVDRVEEEFDRGDMGRGAVLTNNRIK